MSTNDLAYQRIRRHLPLTFFHSRVGQNSPNLAWLHHPFGYRPFGYRSALLGKGLNELCRGSNAVARESIVVPSDSDYNEFSGLF